jgi:Family of unknown function (DUF5989)
MSAVIAFLRAYKSAWLGPVIVAIVVFGALILLSKGQTVLPFLYRFS